MLFFDLGIYSKKSKYIKASGTFSQILNINKDIGLALILLPSGKKKYIPTSYICTLGRIIIYLKNFL